MNNYNRFIASLYQTLLATRDTFRYCIQRDFKAEMYKTMRANLENSLEPTAAFKSFLDHNGENGQKIEEKFREFIKEIYSDDSTVLKAVGDELRVDHAQHNKIFECVVGLSETLRDIIIQYMINARKTNQVEPLIETLMDKDERLYRSASLKFILIDYEKSFLEFNKVMNENKGQPSPQSNFIVQNELSKYASQMRFIRGHCHMIDNHSLDLFDRVIQLLEMVEGRRELRDGKAFGVIFKETFESLNEYIALAEKEWGEAFQAVAEEMKKPAEPEPAPSAPSENA